MKSLLGVEIFTFSSLFYWNLYFLPLSKRFPILKSLLQVTFLLEVLLSDHSSIETSTFCPFLIFFLLSVTLHHPHPTILRRLANCTSFPKNTAPPCAHHYTASCNLNPFLRKTCGTEHAQNLHPAYISPFNLRLLCVLVTFSSPKNYGIKISTKPCNHHYKQPRTEHAPHSPHTSTSSLLLLHTYAFSALSILSPTPKTQGYSFDLQLRPLTTTYFVSLHFPVEISTSLYCLITFLLKSLPFHYFPSEISTWKLYCLITFLLKSLVSVTFWSLSYWSLYFLVTFLLKSLISRSNS